MQPSSPNGRRLRFALLPFVWLIAFAVVALTLEVIAVIRGSSIRQLLRVDTLWPLAILLPSFLLGHTVGLLTMNALAFITPLRRVFDRECADTGRHDLASAIGRLSRWGLVLLALTAAGCAVFILFSP